MVENACVADETCAELAVDEAETTLLNMEEGMVKEPRIERLSPEDSAVGYTGIELVV